MKIIPLSSITVPETRQRILFDPEKIAELSESIEKLGLLQPPVVELQADGKAILRAGERRFKAVGFLAAMGTAIRAGALDIPLGSIPVLTFDELDELTAFEIELEENIIRVDITWQERCAALARLHEIKMKTTASHVDAIREVVATVEKVKPEEVATLDKRAMLPTHQAVLLGNSLSDPDIAKAKTQKDALKILSRKLRKEEDASRAIPPSADKVYHGEALATLRTFPDAHFRAILADPPYGIGIEQLSYQSSSEQQYDDSYETWKPLVRGLFQELRRVLFADAHGYLFCAFERFDELAAVATAAGFEVYPRPLIWDRSPDGRLTTPDKWPRRCYECILYFRRGQHSLYELRGDVLRYPADRDQGNYHGAKKPVELWVDLLQRSTRPGDRVVDPFAGSGSVLRAGKSCGREVWSIEGDAAYFGLMNKLAQVEEVEF